jgi:hypothetical protein
MRMEIAVLRMLLLPEDIGTQKERNMAKEVKMNSMPVISTI